LPLIMGNTVSSHYEGLRAWNSIIKTTRPRVWEK
jgi:hypothetical protein